VAERYAAALLAAKDEYLRERATDMRDLAVARTRQSARGKGRF
jgi:signal transduction protein with GAF and PtsI domain